MNYYKPVFKSLTIAVGILFMSLNSFGQSAAPSLNTPAEGATGLEARFNIAIGTVSGATSYDIELSDDGSYAGSSPAYQASVAGTKRVLSVDSLTYGHTYSLRWRSDNSVYGTTTLTVKDEPITWANINNGTTYDDGDVISAKSQHLTTQFDWEFDTTMLFNSAIKVTGSTDATVNNGNYTFNSDDFINGETYYARNRAVIGSQALTGPWATDIRNFTIGLEAAPSLNQPDAGANDLSTSFTISIGAVSGATSYDIEISENGLFNDTPPAYQGQLSSTSRNFTVSGLDDNTTYTIRWRANNSAYGTTTVTTDASSITTYMNQPNGKYFNFQTSNIPLIQEASAVSYIWQWDTVATFDSPHLRVDTIAANDNSGKFPYDATEFLSGEQYFVRIAIIFASTTGGFGETRNVYASLHLSEVSYPTEGEFINRTSLKMKCFNIDNATQFEIQYADNSSFTGATTVITNYDYYVPGGWNNPGEGGDLTIRAYNWVSGLEYGQDYYVRSRSSNANQAGQWSTTVQFNTGGPSVEIYQPFDGETNVPLTKYVRCESAWYVADLYQFQVDDDPGFGSPTSIISNINGARFDGLSPSTTYYARVRIKIGSTWAPYSSGVSFSTVSGAKFGDDDYTISSEAISIYPNPSQNEFNLITPEADHIDITVLNVSGQVVDSYQGKGGIVVFGSDLPQGIYVVKYSDSEGNTSASRIVKD